jgi:hypothetical protein
VTLSLVTMFLISSRLWSLSAFAAVCLLLIYHFCNIRFSIRLGGILVIAGMALVAGTAIYCDTIDRHLTTSAPTGAMAMNMIKSHVWLGISLTNFAATMTE